MGMQIKKFQAPTLQKALEMVRQELGDGAIILQADPIKSGILGRNSVEVTAAIDRKELSPRFQLTLSTEDSERQAINPASESVKPNFFGRVFKRSSGPLSRSDSKAEAKSADKIKLTEQVKKMAEKAAQEVSPGAGTMTPPSGTMGQLYAMKTFIEPLQKEMEEIKKGLKPQRPERIASTSLLESQINELKNKLQDFISEQKFKESELPKSIQQIMQFWRDKGMTDPQIYSFLQKIEDQGLRLDAESSGQMLEPILSRYLKEGKNAENPKPKIVCLVGTTGVGKTTTIAKMAAFEKLKLGRSVALVTLDDYKIGGTDQLAHYARILEVPFIKLRPDVSFEEQLKALSVDSVFVDTFGVSPRDSEKILELKKQINFRDPVLRARLETHLALPVGMASGDLDRHMEAFRVLGPQYLLFTKWDETENWGGMLASILSYSIPVSFIGHGQEVPDDLSAFSSRDFAKTITRVDH